MRLEGFHDGEKNSTHFALRPQVVYDSATWREEVEIYEKEDVMICKGCKLKVKVQQHKCSFFESQITSCFIIINQENW